MQFIVMLNLAVAVLALLVAIASVQGKRNVLIRLQVMHDKILSLETELRAASASAAKSDKWRAVVDGPYGTHTVELDAKDETDVILELTRMRVDTTTIRQLTSPDGIVTLSAWGKKRPGIPR